MSLDYVRAALEKQVVIGLPSNHDIAWVNEEFTPPEADEWARVSFVPSQPFVFTLGDEGNDQVDGFLQISLMFPQGLGTQVSYKRFDGLRDVFYAGAKYTFESQDVVIRSCGMSQGRNDDGWYRVDVTVFWYAFLSRS